MYTGSDVHGAYIMRKKCVFWLYTTTIRPRRRAVVSSVSFCIVPAERLGMGSPGRGARTQWRRRDSRTALSAGQCAADCWSVVWNPRENDDNIIIATMYRFGGADGEVHVNINNPYRNRAPDSSGAFNKPAARRYNTNSDSIIYCRRRRRRRRRRPLECKRVCAVWSVV